MVQLKQVTLRLKSIKNIQKITKTMKMVSASKYIGCLWYTPVACIGLFDGNAMRFTKAERELAAAKPFGYAPRKFYEASQLVKGPVDGKPVEHEKESAAPTTPAAEEKPEDQAKTKRIYVAVTSDRGLCGGVHSGVSRRIRREFLSRSADGPRHKLICVGEKSRSMLRRAYPSHMLASVKDIGRIAPVFADASKIAAAIAEARYNYDVGEIYYNQYFTPVKYQLTVIPFFAKQKIELAPKMHMFDDVESEAIECWSEWTLAALIFYALKEGAASEQSSRMSAMDSATKNATEMIRKLTLLFNRTRQSVITRELIEIISGAAALK